MPMEDKFSRLPELVKTFRYDIRISPCLETFKVKGSETIYFDTIKATNILKLHSVGLGIENVSLKLADGSVIKEIKFELDRRWELLTLRFPNELSSQKVELNINFSGEISTELQGFYRSSYKGEDGNRKMLASTQFESVYARRAFPCFDEPTYKAEFDIKLEVDEKLTALSNMNVTEEKNIGNGKKVVTFARTPFMSTYLVAFAVGEFEYIESKTKDGCIVRVYTVPGKKDKGHYALSVAIKSIEWFSEWFGIKMPLPKCDLIAIPEFSMGAMENWGLITFREVRILSDPCLSSSFTREILTHTIVHEVGHFWFGNLVTMKWWGDLWLKEGFAKFMEYVLIGHNYKEFKVWMNFVSSLIMSAMSRDSMRISHPIEVPINNPNELEEIYDSITYNKSNSIIRMLFNYLGESTFQKGVQIYLDRFKYSNAITVDLWNCLELSRILSVESLMSSWTQQVGFPLVTVEEKQLDGDKRELLLKQRRFLIDGSFDENKPIWQIPVSITIRSNPTKPFKKFLLTKENDKFIIEDVKPSEWIKVNSDFSSFFRVFYSDEMLNKLLQGIKDREVDVIDRFQIADDLFNVINAGFLPISKFLDFFSVCGNEDNLIVWQCISSCLGKIYQLLANLDDDELLKKFNCFVCKVIEPVSARYGWEPKEGEDIQTSQLRSLLIGRLSRAQHLPTIQIALNKFNEHIEKGIKLVPELRSIIMVTAARSNDEKIVSALQNILTNCNFSEVEVSCISALGQCTDLKLLEKIFKHGVIDKNIRIQDIYVLFQSVNCSTKSASQRFLWNFFKDNLSVLTTFWEPTSSLFQNCLRWSADHFCLPSDANDFKAFCESNFNDNELATLDNTIKRVLEQIMLNEKFMKENSKCLKEYLQMACY
ncbi:Aminopeptidase [Meloidogyne graminicola]|uniref:Aminopeptidase n=1 Tax=Meloidogyne graminicola TaxID=189291 RepID=A0A8S9ZIU0_9BILA|nr:Aminopeptidase [Meloidogyne graminicola]